MHRYFVVRLRQANNWVFKNHSEKVCEDVSVTAHLYIAGGIGRENHDLTCYLLKLRKSPTPNESCYVVVTTPTYSGRTPTRFTCHILRCYGRSLLLHCYDNVRDVQ
jgi:hypothetical protein